jgi:hypothetical protein
LLQEDRKIDKVRKSRISNTVYESLFLLSILKPFLSLLF